MTPLTRLRQIVAARTKGPWSVDQFGDYLWRIISGKLVRRDGVSLAMEIRSASEDDATFIALMGTIADELVGVVEVAEKVRNNLLTPPLLHGDMQHQQWLRIEVEQRFEAFDAALTALKAKLEGMG